MDYHGNRKAVVYYLKDSFGGYCSVREAREVTQRESNADPQRSWRDAGC